ncbi:hypothetical protein [Nocardiopsis lambiniae]|uniref:Uncharacterized protein n=1 Tax=Nocardiopsis lambiniae TaxID=3075539 RepID=A0ABU2MEJ9_9ACTN|nr:hypothetical protein [Nocardiopsis sp. DSM 44743]MDT0330987.1 hypothetical protein [Nocardiopsis sp. DSM 44743]
MVRVNNGRHRKPHPTATSRLWWACASALAGMLSAVSSVLTRSKDRGLRAALEAPPRRPALEAAPGSSPSGTAAAPRRTLVPRSRTEDPLPFLDTHLDAHAEPLVRPYVLVNGTPDLLLGDAAEGGYRFRTR